MDEKAMPQYMSKTPGGTGYQFRRVYPAKLREILGKSEHKAALHGDYRSVCQQCRELAVQTDREIDAARAKLRGEPPESAELAPAIAVNEPPLAEVREVTPEFVARLQVTVFDQVERGYRERRYRVREPVHPAKLLDEIERVQRWANLAWHGDDTAIHGWADMLAGTLKRSGFRLSDELRGSLKERELLIEYANAYRDALEAVKAEYTGVPLPMRQIGTLVGQQGLKPASTADVITLSVAIEKFMSRRLPSQDAMNEKHSFILPAFLEVVGDMPVSELRQKHVVTFLEMVQKLPPQWRHIARQENKRIKEIATQEWPTTIALATYEGGYRPSIHKFLESSKVHYQDVGFPTTLTTAVQYLGSRTKRVQRQRSLILSEIEGVFFNEEMGKIIQSPEKVYKFWLLAVELYTGGRVREICQLNPQQDWGCREGIWWMKFTEVEGALQDEEVVKSIKTSKTRIIPVHAELIRVGFLDYLEALKKAGARRLFPRWSPKDGDAGAGPSKWVSNYMKKIGLHGVMNENGNAVRGSHTFRHTFLTHGKKSGVNLRCISGHRESSDNVVADEYEDDTVLLPLSEMAERLARLDYGVALPTPVHAQVPSTRG